MPLAKEPQVIPKPPEISTTPITHRPGQRDDGAFKNSVVDLRKRSVQTLLAHSEGSQWQVTYFRQLLTKDMEPTSFQVDQIIPYQQYEKIYYYPLRVTDPLTSSQNEETLQFEVNGAGLLCFAIIPNIGDIFIADIGDGRNGIFSIERIVRKTVLMDSVYEVEYTLLEYLDESNDKLINDRVVRNLYYNSDFLGSGRGPLITLEELNNYRNIKNNINDLFCYYTKEFTDKDNTILLRPDGAYDPFIAEYWDNILPRELIKLDNVPRVLLVGDEYENYETILNSIKDKNVNKNIYQKIKLDKVDNKFRNLLYNGISMTNVEEVVDVEKREPLSEIQEKDSDEKSRLLVDFHPVCDTGYYIYSSSFYLNDPLNISKIEYLTLNYLNNKPLIVNMFLDLLLKIKTTNLIDQFYYIPILVTLGLEYLREKT